MKAGIIVYSRTGNTLQVAEKLKSALIAQGHQADVLRVRAEHEEPDYRGPIKLTAAPDPAPYDAVFFGAWVMAFSLTPVMKAYLEGTGPLTGKKVGLFVTHRLPRPWMGGNRAIRQMAALCRDKGAQPGPSAIIAWSGSNTEAQIADAAQKLSSAVG